MSAYHSVYVRELDIRSTAIVAVERALRWTFGPAMDPSRLVYDGGTFFVDYSWTHDLDDEPGLAFESHPITFRVRDAEADKDRELRIARQIFSALVDAGSFSCFMVFNLHNLLAVEKRG